MTVLRLVWYCIQKALTTRHGQIIFSAIVLIMLWGPHGNLELLKTFWPAWHGPGTDPLHRPNLIPGLPWDHELISFWAGAFLLVVVPAGIIRFGFKQSLSRYGLGLPPKGRRTLAVWVFLILTLLSLPAFWAGAHNEQVRQVYPIFNSFSSVGQFVLYELTYLPFFIAIEFIFRGYLLFGLDDIDSKESQNRDIRMSEPLSLPVNAVLIQMLSYTAWHLGKPLPELWGTIVWGFAAAAGAYSVRSIWPVVCAHWLLNVFMDTAIVIHSL